MYTFLSHFFHRETNDKTERGRVNVPQSIPAGSPNDSPRKYSPLFPSLPFSETSGILLDDILPLIGLDVEGSLVPQSKIDWSVLSYILRCGYGFAPQREGSRHRTVPSLGRQYSLEIYVFIFEPLGACAVGLYRMNPREGRLEPIQLRLFPLHERRWFVPVGWPPESRVLIVVTSVFPPVQEVYGSRGYRYSLLEAGHVGQNMLLAASEKGIRLMPLEGIHEEEIEDAIGLNKSRERLVSAWCL